MDGLSGASSVSDSQKVDFCLNRVIEEGLTDVLKKLNSSIYPALAALILLILPALRPAEKYLGSWLWWWPYLLACLLIVWALRKSPNSRLAKFVSSRFFIFGVPIAFALVSTVFYPLADGLKEDMQGQDQDDCTILGVRAILSLANPVATPTYFGNPCSNLLGAILPHFPFVVANVMGLAGPVFFGIAVAVLYLRKVNRLQLGAFVGIVAGTPATLELMVNGSDFVFIGFMSLVAVLLLADGQSREGLRARILLPLAVLVGLIASTRINMPIFALPFGIVLLQRKKWIAFTVAVSAIVLIPNLLVYLSSPSDFAPLHLISKGQSLVPGIFYLLMFASSALAVGLGFLLWSRRAISELSLVLLIVSPHLIFLSFGDLVFNRQFDVFWWEGANYLYLVTPMLAWLAVSRILPFKEEQSAKEE